MLGPVPGTQGVLSLMTHGFLRQRQLLVYFSSTALEIPGQATPLS